jgi:hypothetical protein
MPQVNADREKDGGKQKPVRLGKMRRVERYRGNHPKIGVAHALT